MYMWLNKLLGVIHEILCSSWYGVNFDNHVVLNANVWKKKKSIMINTGTEGERIELLNTSSRKREKILGKANRT